MARKDVDMFCKKCGEKIADSSEFCQFCGTKQVEEKAQVEETPNLSKQPNGCLGVIIIFIVVF